MWSEEEKSCLKDNYLNLSIEEMLELLPGKGDRAIYEMARRMGIKKSGTYDRDCFSIINITSSYWAGFLAADGCISDNGDIQVKLQGKDIDHLRILNSFMGRNIPVREYIRDTNYGESYNTCQMYFRAKEIAKNLSSNYGIGPRKSLTLEAPGWLSNNDALAFIKGYIDGDGFIGLPEGFSYLRLEVLGTLELLEWIKGIVDFLSGHLRRVKKSSNIRCREDNNVYIYQVGGKQAEAFLSILYNLDTPFLARKWKTYTDRICPLLQ